VEQEPEPALGLPAAPDIGFFGRDDALLALDRAFDTDRAVLLHALAGAGKSTTAAEFARRYTSSAG
jgi:MoxR-like ATPase